MDLKQKAIKGVIWSAIESWGTQVISFVVFFVLARLLGPETFGLVALALVVTSFIQMFVDQGFAEAIIQRHELEPEHLDTAFWTSIGIGGLMTVVVAATAEFSANLFHQPQLTPIIRWLSLNFLLTGFISVQQAIFRRNLAFKALAARSVLAMFIAGLVGVTMAFMGYGVWSLVCQQLTNRLAQLVVLWSVKDWQPRWKFSPKHFRELFSFGINVTGLKIINFFSRRSDDLLIGYFLGPTSLGYYTVAYRLLVVMTDLMTGITEKVTLSTFARLQQDPERLQQVFYKATQLTTLIALPAFMGIVVLAPEIVPVVFGKQWMQSIPVMQVLAFIGILHSAIYFCSSVIKALGKPFWLLILNSVNAVVIVISFAVAVKWGIVAVAAAYVISSYLISPLYFLVVRKLTHIELTKYLSQYIYPIVALLPMVNAILVARHFLYGWTNQYVLLAIYIIIGAFFYILNIIVFAPKIFMQIVDIATTLSKKKMEHKT